jgi:hypothetical protein
LPPPPIRDALPEPWVPPMATDPPSPFRSIRLTDPLAPQIDRRGRRPATGDLTTSSPVVAPWPDLARRSGDGDAPPRKAVAPWPELLVQSEDPVERSLDELERTFRVDALVAKLGEKPWNAWPS